ncbi:hypothetical protein HG532_01085 [Moraxella osloensis]|nr:hypothetical protein [Moraxella osloensis]MBW4008626.1 hypothetical protein [Moraxella osloensis]
MTNLSDFLKVEKVKCVNGHGRHLTVGETYHVLGLSIPNNLIQVENDNGFITEYDPEKFEPVLADNSVNIQDIGTDILDTNANIKDTPKFEVGDRVYVGLTGKIETVEYFDIRENEMITQADEVFNAKKCCHATQENYERLQATFPNIKFEKPPKELKGSDLARAMLDKGWKYVPCYVSNTSDKNAVELDDCGVIYTVNHNGNFQDGYGETWCHVVPFDPRTGKPLTESTLND